MINDFSKAASQLNDPLFRRILLRGIGAGIVVFVALIIGAFALLSLFQATNIAWLNTAISFLGVFAAGYVALLLFPAVIGLIVGFFLDNAAAAVEMKHYPALPPARAVSWSDSLGSGARLAGATLLVNLIALPFYLALLFAPPLGFMLFYALNGYLLGREYFELAASRRIDPVSARNLRKRHRILVYVAGVVIAFLFSIPFVNLIAPLLGAAWMVHLFHRVYGQTGAGQTGAGQTGAAVARHG